MLSPYSFEIKNEYDIKTGGINKLVPNLIPKKNYGVHYKNLQYYLSQGLILKKVHRIPEFKQSDWINLILILILKKEKKPLMKLIKSFLNY